MIGYCTPSRSAIAATARRDTWRRGRSSVHGVVATAAPYIALDHFSRSLRAIDLRSAQDVKHTVRSPAGRVGSSCRSCLTRTVMHQRINFLMRLVSSRTAGQL
jgi:hypothetical protein